MSGIREAEGGGGAREALTAPVEDYLKAIYAIGKGTGAAATNEIAQRLALAPASVSPTSIHTARPFQRGTEP